MYKGMLIGKHVQILRSLDKTLVSISGEIVDEKKNILRVRTEGEVRKVVSVPKQICVLELSLNKGTVILDGKEILGTAVERIHKP